MKFNPDHVRTYTDEFLVGVYASGAWHEKQCVSAELAARYVTKFTESHAEGLGENARKICHLEQGKLDAISAKPTA